jgi:hypothetical protein
MRGFRVCCACVEYGGDFILRDQRKGSEKPWRAGHAIATLRVGRQQRSTSGGSSINILHSGKWEPQLAITRGFLASSTLLVLSNLGLG